MADGGMGADRGARETQGGRTVVITGGSAGVGRAVALACARRGDRVGLIARSRTGLDDAAREIGRQGGTAFAAPADIADPDALERAADAIEAALGPIDVWVNAAMVTVFSKVRDLTPEELRRVTEVTYLGNAYGLMTALRRMRPRGRGALVQVGSSLAYRGIPLQAAYCGAKHALQGFLESLWSELAHDGGAVTVSAVHIPAVNTPQFDWARTKTGRLPRPVAPVYQPEAIARHILDVIDRPRREVWVGWTTPLVIGADMLAPGALDRYLGATAIDGQARDRRPPPDRPDNLFDPVEGLHRTHGGFDRESRDTAMGVPAAAARLAGIGAATLLAAGLTAGGMLLTRPRPRARSLGRR